MSARAGARWHAYWFAPAAPEPLAIARLVFFGLLTILYAPYDFRDWADVSPDLWSPTWSFALLHLSVASASTLAVAQVAWKLALASACVGFATRVSTTVALVLGFYLLGLPHGFGKIHHYDAVLIFVFAILALARCGDAYALDRWLARRRHGGALPPRPPSGEYTWPIRAVWLGMALVFFGAGVSKLRTSGLAWIFSDSMAIYLIQHQYHLGNAVPLTTFGLVLARHAWLCHLLAAGTVACEIGYPLALVSPRARRVLVPGTLLMQVGIRVLLGPTFLALMACNVFWIPWGRVWPACQPRRTAARAAS